MVLAVATEVGVDDGDDDGDDGDDGSEDDNTRGAQHARAWDGRCRNNLLATLTMWLWSNECRSLPVTAHQYLAFFFTIAGIQFRMVEVGGGGGRVVVWWCGGGVCAWWERE